MRVLMRNRKETQGAAHTNAEVEMEPGGHKPGTSWGHQKLELELPEREREGCGPADTLT